MRGVLLQARFFGSSAGHGHGHGHGHSAPRDPWAPKEAPPEGLLPDRPENEQYLFGQVSPGKVCVTKHGRKGKLIFLFFFFFSFFV